VNSYNDGETTSADLLARRRAVPGVRRVRFTSPHPNDFSERVIRCARRGSGGLRARHLTMQSGSTNVLKRMLRRYSRDEYFACLERLRGRSRPERHDRHHRGFSGETESDFERAERGARSGFTDAFMFKFSRGEGTPARGCPPNGPYRTRSRERMDRLVDNRAKRRSRQNLGLLGRQYEVLVEREARRGGELLQARRVISDGARSRRRIDDRAVLTVELTALRGDVHGQCRTRSRSAPHGRVS